MKYRRVILPIVLLSSFLIACSPQINDKLRKKISRSNSDLVIVKPDKAIFIFKLNHKGPWKWHQKKNSKFFIEYHWMAVIQFSKKGYMIGYALQYIPNQHPRPEQGSLEELINAGKIVLYTLNLKRKQISQKRFIVRTQSYKRIYNQVIYISSNIFAIIVDKKGLINKFKNFHPKNLNYTFLSPTKGRHRKKVKIVYDLK